MRLTKRFIELENKTDADSVLEMQRINEKFEELDVRLNVLLGNTLVN
jgi:NAD/NADP transhydrogenase beta subunit